LGKYGGPSNARRAQRPSADCDRRGSKFDQPVEFKRSDGFNNNPPALRSPFVKSGFSPYMPWESATNIRLIPQKLAFGSDPQTRFSPGMTLFFAISRLSCPVPFTHTLEMGNGRTASSLSRNVNMIMNKRLHAALSAKLLLICFAVGQVNADTISYWRFEEGTNGVAASGADSILDSAFSNHGTPSGDPFYDADVPVPTVPVTGMTNALSLLFDGSGDTVIIGTNAALDSAAPFTTEFWMKSADTSSGQKLLVDKSHGFGDTTGWFFQSNPGSGFIDFGVGNGSFPVVTSQSDLFDDQWHHIAGTYDGNSIEMFVDGVSQAELVVGTYTSNTRDIRIGSARNNGRFFNGRIDEVRISNTVLAPSQFLAVPEPSSIVLLGIGAIGLVFRRRRNQA